MEYTLEEILVLYQMAVTGRPGNVIDNDAERTKEVADAIRMNVAVQHNYVVITGQQLMTSCAFAGISIDPAALEGKEELLEHEFTIEGYSDIYLADGLDDDGIVYRGMSIHYTDDESLGYQPLEPDKWPHQEGEHN